MLDSFRRALAVSSIKLVSRSPHRSSWKAFALLADNWLREGTGRIDELNDAAISSRVSLISALSFSKGMEIRAFILSLSAAKVGRVSLSLMSESSNPVGI
jgi:hypothetical protein